MCSANAKQSKPNWRQHTTGPGKNLGPIDWSVESDLWVLCRITYLPSALSALIVACCSIMTETGDTCISAEHAFIMDAGLGQQALRLSFLEDMGPSSKFVQRARFLEVKATVSLYDVFNRISGKAGRAMWPKGFCSAIASCNATVPFFHGHADGVTRELTW